jgi:hypothetical protein
MVWTFDKLIDLFKQLMLTDRFKSLLSAGAGLIMTHYFPIWANKTAECIAIFCILFSAMIAIEKIYRKLNPVFSKRLADHNRIVFLRAFLKRLTPEHSEVIAKLWYSDSHLDTLPYDNGAKSLLSADIIFVDQDMKYLLGMTDMCHYMYGLHADVIRILKKDKKLKTRILKDYGYVEEIKKAERLQRDDIAKQALKNTIESLKPFYAKLKDQKALTA